MAPQDRILKFGVADAQTYHWLHIMKAMGQIDATITSNYPIAAVFNDTGDKTYDVAHNYSDSPITVTFSDGFMLDVPANLMATSKDLRISASLLADIFQANESDTFNLTATAFGSGITKVEFHNDAFLLGDDTSVPYEFAITNIPPGIHNIYARVYVGTEFVVSNIITVQVGNQLPYSGVVHAIPGTIDAAHYDYFKGGIGQNISYFDSSTDNQENFRVSEYVDAVSIVGEDDTIGWITACEWLEYIINVQTTGY